MSLYKSKTDYMYMTNEINNVYIDINKCLPKHRYLSQAELEMEEMLTGEMLHNVYYPNVWNVQIPKVHEKHMYVLNSFHVNGEPRKTVRKIDSIVNNWEERIFITDEYESEKDLTIKLGAFLLRMSRPDWGHPHIIMGKGTTISLGELSYRPKMKPKKDRTNNGAKWKKQSKPYHQR